MNRQSYYNFAAVLGAGFWVLVLSSGLDGKVRAQLDGVAGARKPEEFDIWQLAWELKRRVYAFTSTSAASQDRRFCEDIRRAARSGPDNVAEGFYRFNPKEFHRFLNDAKASLGGSAKSASACER